MLLFDQNLSARLVIDLADIFPGSRHVRDFDLQRANDDLVWETARRVGLAIVSKDADFHQRSLLFGPPPKLIWLRVGNGPTADIELLLRSRVEAIKEFIGTDVGAFLALR